MKKERGVVIEEWRTGRDASTRVQNRQFPVMLQGSKYALRVPIGTKENLESFPDSLAVKFYRDWYRPDLMTVIAVGDFDAAQMEASIKQRFAAIKGPAAPRTREYAAVPDHDQTLVSIETDKEYPLASVGLLWLKPRDSVRHGRGFPPHAGQVVLRRDGQRALLRDLAARRRTIRVRAGRARRAAYGPRTPTSSLPA